MGRFRKKPVVIEAVQLTWETWNEVCDFVGPFPEGMRGCYIDSKGVAHDQLAEGGDDRRAPGRRSSGRSPRL